VELLLPNLQVCADLIDEAGAAGDSKPSPSLSATSRDGDGAIGVLHGWHGGISRVGKGEIAKAKRQLPDAIKRQLHSSARRYPDHTPP
jgi:hypothetical protein